MDTFAALIAFAAIVLGGQGLALFLNRRNHRPAQNPHDPDDVRLGDVSVGWWQREMRELVRDAVAEGVREAMREYRNKAT